MNSDKRDYGHALVLAGSDAYPGAALLTARAALCSGSGLVTLATARSIRPAVLRRFSPEVMPVFLPESGGGVSLRALPILRKLLVLRRVNAAAIGPGLGRAASTAALVRALVKSLTVPGVLDADGLNAFVEHLSALKRRHGPLVLTPHAGEFERLFGRRVPVSAKKKGELAKRLSRSYDVVLVLKGHKTLVVYRDRMAVNSTGNPGMAKGGSGDALTGIVAAFIAQGMDPFKAAVWGVYFHGRAGDLAARRSGPLSLTAGDLIETLPKAFAGQVRWGSSVGRAAVLFAANRRRIRL